MAEHVKFPGLLSDECLSWKHQLSETIQKVTKSSYDTTTIALSLLLSFNQPIFFFRRNICELCFLKKFLLLFGFYFSSILLTLRFLKLQHIFRMKLLTFVMNMVITSLACSSVFFDVLSQAH